MFLFSVKLWSSVSRVLGGIRQQLGLDAESSQARGKRSRDEEAPYHAVKEFKKVGLMPMTSSSLINTTMLG
jgi:hypothetical protein